MILTFEFIVLFAILVYFAHVAIQNGTVPKASVRNVLCVLFYGVVALLALIRIGIMSGIFH
jgi:uncharacterized protein YhhL (DUF1145 family)